MTDFDRYALGVAFIDQEHRNLFKIYDDLETAIATGGEDRFAVARTLDWLKGYTVSYFAHEELAMERSGYPRAAGHVATHQQLVADLCEHEERFAAGLQEGRLLIDFLRTWLVRHIDIFDRDVARYLLAQGGDWADGNWTDGAGTATIATSADDPHAADATRP